MVPNCGESYVILSWNRILHHNENGGTGLHTWTWINSSLLIRKPETILHIFSRKSWIQEIRSYKIIGRDREGAKPKGGGAPSRSRSHRQPLLLMQSPCNSATIIAWGWGNLPLSSHPPLIGNRIETLFARDSGSCSQASTSCDRAESKEGGGVMLGVQRQE